MKKWTIVANLFLLVAVGCSKNKSTPRDHGAISASQNKEFFEAVGVVKPYNPNNPYATKMSECIYADTPEKSCSVSQLPLIGIAKDTITIQDILDRTMISHDFLGETFKQVLLKMNPEMLQMFGSVTAVVVSDKINPSFFFSDSGAIYLSGRFFWRDAEEWKTLTQVKDYRDNFGLPLQFIFDHDYIKNKESITHRAQKNFQNYDEMAINTSKLLFHELTHANDYFPRNFYKSQDLDFDKTYQKIAHEREINSQLISDQQSTQLTSVKLKHVGQILFQGIKATPEDSAMLAEEAIEEFKKDIASDAYAYSDPQEDLAMCAEEALMLYYYNIPRYVVVIKLPEAHFTVPENYIYQIAWGEKSRVLEPNIKNRAIFAVENDLGKSIGQKVSEKLNQFSPKEIPANSSWDDLYKL